MATQTFPASNKEKQKKFKLPNLNDNPTPAHMAQTALSIRGKKAADDDGDTPGQEAKESKTVQAGEGETPENKKKLAEAIHIVQAHFAQILKGLAEAIHIVQAHFAQILKGL